MVSPLHRGPGRSAGLVRGIVRPPAQRGRARAVLALPSAAGGRWHTASADAKDLGDGYASERMPAHGVTHSLEGHLDLRSSVHTSVSNGIAGRKPVRYEPRPPVAGFISVQPAVPCAD